MNTVEWAVAHLVEEVQAKVAKIGKTEGEPKELVVVVAASFNINNVVVILMVSRGETKDRFRSNISNFFRMKSLIISFFAKIAIEWNNVHKFYETHKMFS